MQRIAWIGRIVSMLLLACLALPLERCTSSLMDK